MIIFIYETIEELPFNLLRIEHHIYNNMPTAKFLMVRQVNNILIFNNEVSNFYAFSSLNGIDVKLLL